MAATEKKATAIGINPLNITMATTTTSKNYGALEDADASKKKMASSVEDKMMTKMEQSCEE